MSEYLDFPPSFFFEIALKNCPDAAFIYKELWRFFDGQLNDILPKDKILKTFGITPTRFRNQLLLLKTQGLLGFKENKKSYKIDLAPFDEKKR